VFETATDQQFRFGTPGPILTPQELDACRAHMAAIDPGTPYLVLSGSMPEGAPDDFYAQLASHAPPGCRVVLDTSGAALARGSARPCTSSSPTCASSGSWRACRSRTTTRCATSPVA
jgi:fructose-1-phosphate kinase PfkB-like protein